MKTNNNKGFTLIELIMVIVILGILAAVAVPKFFDLTSQAQTKNKAAVVGNIKAGIQLFAANKIVTTGSRTFPKAPMALSSILDEVPEDWSLVHGAAGTDSILYHQGSDNWKAWTYKTTASDDSTGYTLSAEATR
ncbi:MAG: type II secretion system protein [Candidatus Marinimicrobia bacterium]|nr:type II secretion system protein [Candidatus Neomarinimicrobiota bacterium]